MTDEVTVGCAVQSMAEIKDSGNRREFKTGACRDMAEGKGRMDLLPWAAIIEVSKHCERGAKKYGEHNVDKGLPLSSLCDSAARHLGKFFAGHTDENHLLAAAWNLLWAVQINIGDNDELKDVPFRTKKHKPKCNFNCVEYTARKSALAAKELYESLAEYAKAEV